MNLFYPPDERRNETNAPLLVTGVMIIELSNFNLKTIKISSHMVYFFSLSVSSLDLPLLPRFFTRVLNRRTPYTQTKRPLLGTQVMIYVT